jgi:hypothetical protein
VKTSETNEAAALRALVGYQINKNFAVELGYFATDDFKQDGTNRTGTVRYNVKADVKGADLSLIYKFTEFVPGLYLKAGATHSKVSLTLNQPAGSSGRRAVPVTCSAWAMSSPWPRTSVSTSATPASKSWVAKATTR